MQTVVDFTSQVFAFIENTYGKGIIKKVKLKKNGDIVDRILSDSLSKEYDSERTGNKLVAMLRLNP
jgi:hypothetical protein